MSVLATTTNSNLLTALTALHVIFAAYFGLGVLLAMIFALQLPNTPGLRPKARVMGNASRVALSMVVPGAVLSGALGFAVAITGGFGLRTPWVVQSIVLFAIVFILGGALGPMGARLRRRVEAEAKLAKPSAEVIAALRSPVSLILNAVNFVITVVLVLIMFFKF